MNDGGPAFPRPIGEALGTVSDGYAGMSLRDWFAGMALQLAGATALEMIMRGRTEPLPDEDSMARKCYATADAMLKARGQ